MPRQIVHGALSALTLVVAASASSAWSAAAPWVPNTTGNVGPAPATFNKWEAIEAPASSTDRRFNRMRPSIAPRKRHQAG
ncbi:MAG: hypothetical protein KA899_12590 [Acidovorax sp.]|jgi:hypothetical protein|nr:hypothetical protein [Acidovorax sp.]